MGFAVGGPEGYQAYSAPLILRDEVFQGAGRRTVLDFRNAGALNNGACVVLLGSAKLLDCTVIGPNGFNGVIRVVDGEGAVVSGVRASGGQHSCIAVRGGEGVEISNCWVTQPQGAPGYGYGLALEGTTDARVVGGRFHARRHGIAMGNDPRTGLFSSHCKVSHARISSEEIYAADTHQNTSHCSYERCRIEGGLVMGGTGHRIERCYITPAQTGECILVDAASSLDSEIVGNAMRGDAGATKALVYFDQNEFAPQGGELRITGNTVRASNGCPMFLRARYGGMSLVVDGNSFSSASDTPVRTRSFGGARWGRIDRMSNRYDVAPEYVGAAVDNAVNESVL